MTTSGTASQIIDGTMLSDGSIQPHGTSAQFIMALSGARHTDWLTSVARALAVFGVEPCSGHPKVVSRVSSYGKPYECCLLVTRIHPFLSKQRTRWYPKGSKVIPRDVRVTPLMLANAYMGDGNVAPRTKQGAPHLMLLTLSMQGFTVEDLLFFAGKLGALGVDGHVSRKSSNGYRISNTRSVNLFVDLVEPFILPSYKYKIRRSGRDYH